MIELILAAGLTGAQPMPRPHDGESHVWRAHGDHECATARYGARVAGTDQIFQLVDCGEWRLTVASDAETAAGAGLTPGAIVFSGFLNDEIGAPEGEIALPGRCGEIRAQAAPTLSRPWTPLGLGTTITFTLPAESCDAGRYGRVLKLTRLPDAPLDPLAAPVPAQGCGNWRIVGDGNHEFTPRIVRVCVDGSTLTGTAGGKPVLEGVIWSLDGTIEAAYTPPAPDGCPVRPYRVTGTARPGATFALEGYAPVVGETCGLEGYDDVQLRFEPAGT